jgi:beta-glucosidase
LTVPRTISNKSSTFPPTLSTVTITNTGHTSGAEVLQLFLSRLSPSVFFRPPRELKGFEKVFLQPGETRKVNFEIDRESLSVWDEKFRGENEEVGAWRIEKGQYIVEICAGDESVKGEFEVLEDSWERGL